MVNKKLNTAENRMKYIMERNEIVAKLNSRMGGLDRLRVKECREQILKSYEEATIVNKIAIVRKEQNIESHRFRSIGLHQAIRTRDFNDKSYYWNPYFSEVGRTVARGEEYYIHKRLGRIVRGGEKRISLSDCNFDVLNKTIRELLESSVKPDTILAPVQILPQFTIFYSDRLDWSRGYDELLVIEDCRLNVFWSHKYAPLNSFLVFSSKAGVWHVIQDSQESNPTLTIAIGESDKPRMTEYLVEVLAFYQITNPKAFRRVNISR